jgi:hypothetical protein
VAVSLGLVACATEEGPPAGGVSEGVGSVAQAVVTEGDWGDYTDGQCVIGAQHFYKTHFGVTLKATGVQSGDIGNCLYLGACMFWVSDKVRPDPNLWDQHPWGDGVMPQTYDLVIYPPKPGTSNYGHVASVDHMEGGDPNNYGNLYIMDSNFNGNEKKASGIHTFASRQPYGFYRLKSLAGCSAHCEGNVVVDGNCNKNDCGNSQSSCVQDGLGPHCVYPACPADGDARVCDSGNAIVTCHDGSVTGRDDCKAAGQVCSVAGDLHCDAPPRGNLDQAGCEAITGWAQDPSAADAPAAVHLYFGGAAGDPDAVGVPIQAAAHRDDLCGAISSCNHGFSFPTPQSLLDGQPHPLHAYGIDASGGPNAELGASPLVIQCAPPTPAPSAQLRRVNDESSFTQWAFSPFQDVAPAPSDPARVGADMGTRGPDLPVTPRFVRADDGTDGVWLIDTGVRRLVPGADAVSAWHAGSIESWPAPKLYELPQGAPLPATPRLLRAEGPTFWLVDGAFLPAGAPPTSPAPTTTGTAGTSPAPTPTTDPAATTPPGATPGGTTVGPTASEQEAQCAVGAVGAVGRGGAPGGAGAALVLGLVALLGRGTGRRVRRAS